MNRCAGARRARQRWRDERQARVDSALRHCETVCVLLAPGGAIYDMAADLTAALQSGEVRDTPDDRAAFCKAWTHQPKATP